MKLTTAAKNSVFRKVALAAWGGPGDPSVYGLVELDVTALGDGGSPLPLILKALARTMAKHPELNSVMRWGRIHYRRHVSISVMVNLPRGSRHDLSVALLSDAERMSLDEIRAAISAKAELIRGDRDPHLGFARRLIGWIPARAVRTLLGLYTWIVNDVGLSTRWLGLPAMPFGSVIVSNVGSFGVKKALLPLVPLTRAAMLISVGETTKEPRVIEDQILIRRIVHLGVTFDHRFFDGSHAGLMLKDFERAFAEERDAFLAPQT